MNLIPDSVNQPHLHEGTRNKFGTCNIFSQNNKYGTDNGRKKYFEKTQLPWPNDSNNSIQEAYPNAFNNTLVEKTTSLTNQNSGIEVEINPNYVRLVVSTSLTKQIRGNEPDINPNYVRVAATRGTVTGVTKTAVFLVTGWKVAAVSRRSQISFRFSSITTRFSSSSWNFLWQAKNRSPSISENIFLMFIVTFRTDWFQ